MFLGSLASNIRICQYNSQGQYIAGQPAGCYNLVPVFDWIHHCIISILLVFMIAFLPLFLQGKSPVNLASAFFLCFATELVERGTGRAIIRLGKQFCSLSPVFEVFSTQIYTHSILTNLTFGGARYISTGRGFATSRMSFSVLFSRFAGPSIYLGMRTLILLLYVTLTLWTPFLLYFWVSISSLCVAPFLFNPHQFAFSDFIIDYRSVFLFDSILHFSYSMSREFLRWMCRGNSRSHKNSWIGYCRLSRTMITGYKKKKLGHPSERQSGDVPRAGWRAVIVSEVLFPIALAVLFIIAYLFVKSFPDPDGNQPASPLTRIAVIALGPIVWNAGVLLTLFLFSLFLGPVLDPLFPLFGSIMAFTAHILGAVGMIGFFEFLVCDLFQLAYDKFDVALAVVP